MAQALLVVPAIIDLKGMKVFNTYQGYSDIEIAEELDTVRKQFGEADFVLASITIDKQSTLQEHFEDIDDLDDDVVENDEEESSKEEKPELTAEQKKEYDDIANAIFALPEAPKKSNPIKKAFTKKNKGKDDKKKDEDKAEDKKENKDESTKPSTKPDSEPADDAKKADDKKADDDKKKADDEDDLDA